MLNKLTDVTEVYCCDELFDAGVRPDDGQRQEGLRAVVEVETPDGFRWRHNRAFVTSGWVTGPDTGESRWINRISYDMAQANRLVRRVRMHLLRGGKLDRQHWYPVQGRYGSAAWDECSQFDLEMQEG